MDRYPRSLDPSRDSLSRRFADHGVSAGTGAILALVIGGEAVDPWVWWVAGGLLIGSLGIIGSDEKRHRWSDARAWTTDQWHQLREKEYRRRQGIFLTHVAAQTEPPPGTNRHAEQWWSVTVRLVQHGIGPLTEDGVKEVEYDFGPKFTVSPVIARDASTGFSHNDQLYGPLMVVARVVFKNRLKRPLLVERYIDLPDQ